jgi:hypothetical protein
MNSAKLLLFKSINYYTLIRYDKLLPPDLKTEQLESTAPEGIAFLSPKRGRGIALWRCVGLWF